MSLVLRYYLGLCTVAIFVTTEIVDINLNVDRTNWEDPLDPFAKYSSSDLNELTLEKCKDELLLAKKICTTTVKPAVDPTLKHIVRNILRRLNVDIDRVNVIDKSAKVYLNSYDVETLRQYLSGSTDTLSEREQIRDLLENFIVQQSFVMEEERYWTGLMKVVTPYLPIFNIIILPPALFILLYNLRFKSSFISVVFLMLFSISFATVYYRTYQKNIASRLARSHLSLSEHCKPKGFLHWCLRWFIQGEDQCVQLHEDMYVDPFFEISPLDVLSEVLSNFIFTPLSHLSHHLNIFFTNFYYDSSIPLFIVKTVFIMIFPMLLMFWLCGYRLRTVFATIEPAASSSTVPVAPLLCNNGESSTLKITAPVKSSFELVLPTVKVAENKSEEKELILSPSSQASVEKCVRRRSRASSAGSRY